jgi:hypothetical protein
MKRTGLKREYALEKKIIDEKYNTNNPNVLFGPQKLRGIEKNLIMK